MKKFKYMDKILLITTILLFLVGLLFIYSSSSVKSYMGGAAAYNYFKKHNNTLASTLGGNLKRKKYYADVYKYSSTRNNALSNNLIPEEVYDNLVSVVKVLKILDYMIDQYRW